MKKAVLVCVVVAGAALSATGFAVPLQKGHIPAAAKWVFHVDFEAFGESILGRLVCHEIQARHQGKLDAIKQFTGSDPMTDFYGLTVFGTDSAQSSASALIYGTFDRDQLLGLLMLNPAYGESAHGDRMLYRWQDPLQGKNHVGAFATDHLIVIAQTQDGVAAVLDVLDGKAEALTAETNPSLWRLTEWTPGAFMAAAATDMPDLIKGQEHAAILRNSQALSMMAFEENGDFRLFADLEANSIEAAQQVEQVALGMLSYVMLKQQEHPELGVLIQGCSMTRTDTNIAFEFRFPSVELMEVVRVHAPRLKMFFNAIP